ncbi:unnamed protein product [Didymodactylos carnosus]|uniref:G-protein coupled receptors family 1 profile domain-containing protein n=1 Tax=Didymodactylos carnosus TaxID=1234261 RepID=A0A814RHB9_9BILA|nr:unnamed protein product [Didymodactylos carnosus]CAF3896759.1 unnamed protein product [Didymodactylos carnosus]
MAKCPPCFTGLACKTRYNFLALAWAPSMSADIIHTVDDSEKSKLSTVYVTVVTVIVIISIINNLMTLETAFCRKIRITPCGLYLIFNCICCLISIILVEILVVLMLFDHNLFFCKYLTVIAKPLFGHLSLWISSFIAVERVLIECFNFSLFGTRNYSVIATVLLFILMSLSNIHKIYFRQLLTDPIIPTSTMCTFLYSNNWKTFDKIMNHLHLIVPCLIHLLSTSFVLQSIVRQKVYLACASSHQFWPTYRKQLFNHKDFLIPPILIILCTIPHVLYIDIKMNDCVQARMKHFIRAHIALELLFYLPHTFTFFIYVYPAPVYRQEFYSTNIGRAWKYFTFQQEK